MLKASDALRVGAKIRPQVFGFVYESGGTCAVGALFEGAFGRLPDTLMGAPCITEGEYARLLNAYPELSGATPPCPVCLHTSATAYGMMQHLNDGHSWTREEIADWLDSVLGVPLELPARRYAAMSATFGPKAADVDTLGITV